MRRGALVEAIDFIESIKKDGEGYFVRITLKCGVQFSGAIHVPGADTITIDIHAYGEPEGQIAAIEIEQIAAIQLLPD